MFPFRRTILHFDFVYVWFDTVLCEPLFIVFIFYEVFVCGCYFPTFPVCSIIKNLL